VGKGRKFGSSKGLRPHRCAAAPPTTQCQAAPAPLLRAAGLLNGMAWVNGTQAQT